MLAPRGKLQVAKLRRQMGDCDAADSAVSASQLPHAFSSSSGLGLAWLKQLRWSMPYMPLTFHGRASQRHMHPACLLSSVENRAPSLVLPSVAAIGALKSSSRAGSIASKCHTGALARRRGGTVASPHAGLRVAGPASGGGMPCGARAEHVRRGGCAARAPRRRGKAPPRTIRVYRGHARRRESWPPRAARELWLIYCMIRR